MVLDSMLWELGCVHMKLEVKLFSLKKKKKKKRDNEQEKREIEECGLTSTSR